MQRAAAGARQHGGRRGLRRGPRQFLGAHAGDLHVAAEGQRADRVLGLATPDAKQRRRKEQREALYAHADRLGRGEVPQLVQHDQRDDAEDRQNPAHHTSLAGGRPRSAGSRPSLQRRRHATISPHSGRVTHYGLRGGPSRRQLGASRVARHGARPARTHAGDVSHAHAPGDRTCPRSLRRPTGRRARTRGRASRRRTCRRERARPRRRRAARPARQRTATATSARAPAPARPAVASARLARSPAPRARGRRPAPL